MRGLGAALVIFLLLAGVPPVGAEEEAKATDCETLFAWFRSLSSYDGPADKPWVSVYTGMWSRSGDDAPTQTPRTGFLLAEDGEHFDVLFLDLAKGRYKRTKPDTPAHERVDFERIEPAAHADGFLKVMAELKDRDDPWRRFGARTGEFTEVFVLALAADGQGLTDHAKRLCALAAELGATDRRGKKRTLRQALEHDLAHARTWRLVVAFGGDSFAIDDPEREGLVARKDLLAGFKALAKDFPESPHAERVETTIALLQKMVEEDEAHAARPKREWKELSKKEQIAELIWQLRDQNGQQWSQPGWCDVFADPRGDESPAKRLVAMGFDAVPQLIEALDDERFTRSVGFHRNFYFSHTVLRVSDCVEAILSSIAGSPFWEPATTSSTVGKDGKTKSVKEQAQAWWEAIQERGEEAVLADGVRAGGRDAVDRSDALVRRFPKAAAAALIEGIGKTDDAWARIGLIDMLTRVEPTESVLTALRTELADGPTLGARIAAVRTLWHHGKRDGLEVALGAWRALAPEETTDSFGFGSDDTGALIAFLVGCGEPTAIEALDKGLDRHPLRRRYGIVSGLTSGGPSMMMATGPAAAAGGTGGDADGPPKWRAAVEALLVGRLLDLERMEGMSGSWNGVNFSDPRIADIAAYALSQRFPKRYTFDLGATQTIRDRQRIMALNVWRRANGQDTVPLPKRRRVARTPAAELEPLLKAASGAEGEAQADATARLEALGLAALPGLLAHANALDEKHPRRAPLVELASRLGAHVAVLRVEGPEPAKDSALARAIDALKDRPLDGKHVTAVLLEAAKALPEGSRAVRFEARREPDLTGIVVRIAFEPGKPRSHHNGPGWEHGTRIHVGRRAITGSHGSSNFTYLQGADAWKETGEQVDEAVAMPPDRSLVVRVSLTLTVAKD
ncbi:MAG: hypothetical protein QNJ98_17590 [Planctomycetota bacterium]|nr:hypothetical protein [Planctomycetota bacterium]